MRILEIIEGLDSGGAQRFVVDLCNELAVKNEVALGNFIDRPNCNFYEGDLISKVKRLNYKLTPGILLRFRQVAATIKMILRFKPQFVHLHDTAFVPGIIPSLIFPNIKFFYTVHNIANKDAGGGIGSKLRKIFLKRSIIPITISNYCAKTFVDYYGYPSVAVIDNGCRALSHTPDYDSVRTEIEGYKISRNTKIFLNIARFYEQKNHELLIGSFNSLIREGYDLVLLIIGSSPDDNRRIYLESLVEDKRRIIFLGAKHNVQDYLMSSEYFCLSSSWEGLPITILEAGLCGCYSVSTPVGGVPDVLQDDSVGILSRDLSITSYKDAILRALRMNPDRTLIRKYYLSKYTMTECAKKYIQVFERD